MCFLLIGQICQKPYSSLILTNDSEHHLHDGAHLCVSLGLLLPAQHALHQAGGGVAPGQPGLPLPYHHYLHHSSGHHEVIMIHCQLCFQNVVDSMDTVKRIGQQVYPIRDDKKTSRDIILPLAMILRIIMYIVIPTFYVILSCIYFVYFFVYVANK